MKQHTIHIRIVLILVILGLMAVMYSLLWIGRSCPMALRVKEPGKSVIVRLQDQQVYSGISQIVTSEKYIFVLYDHHCIVSVYDLTGAYQYTISVYSHQNGGAKIAAKDNTLYIRDKVGNLYAFEENRLVQFIDRELADEEIDFSEQSSSHILRGSSIFSVEESGETHRLITRPAWFLFFQDGLSHVMIVLLMMILIMLTLSGKKRRPQ